MASSTTTVLITGTKAGIGRALLESYALRPNHTVIAAIRDAPTTPIAKSLAALPTGKNSIIIPVQYDASSSTSADTLVANLPASIDHLDVVIANAGILQYSGPIKKATADDFNTHFNTNTVGPILLYKATAALLNASTTPKFFIISSVLGSNGRQDEFNALAVSPYCISKAAVNWAAGKIHREEEKIIVVPVQPGWVQTAMGAKAAETVGMEAKDVPVTIEQSVKGLLGVFDKATKKEHSGRFWDQNGEELPW